MELSAAMTYIDGLNLHDEPMDFSTMSDKQLMEIIINVHLINETEAKLFIDELDKRGLSKKYHDRYKPRTIE